MVGMGRIGQAIARRLEALQVPVVYHSRNPQAGVAYKHYPKLVDMARDVDTLIVDHAGRADDREHLINAEVLDALGPRRHRHQHGARHGGRRRGADQGAAARRRSYAAGLDVFVNEPEVPKEYLALDNVVLFPHLGSASVATRRKMDQLVVDNLLAWGAGKPPLTPVPETPWPPKKPLKQRDNLPA